MCESGKRETGKQGHTDKTRTRGGSEEKCDRYHRHQDLWINGWSVGKGREREWEVGRRESGGNEREGNPSPAPEGAKRTIDHQVERGVHHTKPRAPSRRIHAGAYATRAVQGGSPNKSAERRRTGEGKRVTAAVDADDVALGQDRSQPLFSRIVESYTSAVTLTVEATDTVAFRRRHKQDMYSPSAAFVSHLNTLPLRLHRPHNSPGRGSGTSCGIQAWSCPPCPLAGLEELIHTGELLGRPKYLCSINRGKGVQRLSMARRMHGHAELARTSRQGARRAEKNHPESQCSGGNLVRPVPVLAQLLIDIVVEVPKVIVTERKRISRQSAGKGKRHREKNAPSEILATFREISRNSSRATIRTCASPCTRRPSVARVPSLSSATSVKLQGKYFRTFGKFDIPKVLSYRRKLRNEGEISYL
ncbi:hypothetical protein K438DRAFT_1937296, partial [Mycena galopus ATCC 62051]